jgi:hypothetical protein
MVWAVSEPFDRRVLRSDYSDVAVLGKAFTDRGWLPLGLALHGVNGAAFGLALYEAARLDVRLDSRRGAVAAALAEHVILYPLSYLVDRHHPRSGEPGVRALFTPRAFAQATWRHALFGLALGQMVARSRRRPC